MSSGHPWNAPGSPTPAWRRTGLALWVLVLGALTLFPQPTSRTDPHLPQISFCLICGDRGVSDAVLNVLLFSPLGLLLDPRRWKRWQALGVGFALSLSIEFAQHFVPGRYSNLGDVVWNTLGAWLGAVVVSRGELWLPPAPRWGRRLANVAMLVPPMVTLAFGWLMEPRWPEEPYWGQWTADLGVMEQYDGSVVRARLDTIAVPPGPFPPGHHPRAILMGDWTLSTVVVKGTPPRSLAPILSIFNAAERDVTILGARDEDLVYSERSRAQLLKLDHPDLRLPGALAGASRGDTVEIGVRRRGPERCLRVDGREACPAFTPGRAWSLLLWVEGPVEGARRSLDGLWLFLLFTPVGFWSGTWRGVAARGSTATIGVLVAVALTRLAAPFWTELAAAALALLGGHALRLVVGRHLTGEGRDPERA